jgi:hypothetical protein
MALSGLSPRSPRARTGYEQDRDDAGAREAHPAAMLASGPSPVGDLCDQTPATDLNACPSGVAGVRGQSARPATPKAWEAAGGRRRPRSRSGSFCCQLPPRAISILVPAAAAASCARSARRPPRRRKGGGFAGPPLWRKSTGSTCARPPGRPSDTQGASQNGGSAFPCEMGEPMSGNESVLEHHQIAVEYVIGINPGFPALAYNDGRSTAINFTSTEKSRRMKQRPSPFRC